MSLSHHSAAAAKRKQLTFLLEQARIGAIKKRKAWKLDPSDSVRFEFQKALSLVDRLEKELWKFQ